MSRKLFPHQLEDADFLFSRERGALFSEMGTGKTLTAIDAARRVNGKKLVFCPKIAVDMWRSVLDDEGEDAVVVRTGSQGKLIGTATWTIVPYSLVSKLRYVLAGFDVCILDEAHYLKNRSAQRTKAVYGFGASKGIVSGCRYVFALTGTPMPNHAGELYPLIRTLAPELIRLKRTGKPMTERSWQYRFCSTKTQYVSGGRAVEVITGTKNHALLRNTIKPFYRRRLLEDVAPDVPPVTTQLYPLDSRGQFRNGMPVSFYNKPTEAQRETRLDLEKILSGGPMDYEQAMRMRPGSQSTLRRELGRLKVPHAHEAIKTDMEGGVDKAVVFFWHRDVGRALRELLRMDGVQTHYIDGSTSGENRVSAQTGFRKADVPAAFLGQIGACGVAIDLQFAHDVYFVEMSWVPGDNAQALGRCVRIGQTSPVNARFFAGQDNVEYNVVKTLIRKIEDIYKVIQ